MQGAREPSMEDILASIKKVIAEEKELRAAAPPPLPVTEEDEPEDDVLELDDPVAEAPKPERVPVDLGPPLASEEAVDTSRQKLAVLQEVAAAAPPPPVVNPFESMVRDMVRPMMKEWLDAHLSDIVDEHVRREIGRITGTPLN
jgi:cell pole-organizing protein PopZ